MLQKKSFKSKTILLAVIVMLISAICCVPDANSDPVPVGRCENKFPNLIDDINWGAMFPLRLGGMVVLDMGDMPDNVDTSNPDDFNPEEFICTCPGDDLIDDVGVWLSFWEPARVWEVTMLPGCFSFLFGTDMGEALEGFGVRGTRGGQPNELGDKAFYNVHMYAFPLMLIMEIIGGGLDFCSDWFTDIDLGYSTIFDPLWGNDELSIWLNPEAAAFGNPIAQALCAADCVTASAGYPINSMFWCAGCWGSLYPYTGNTSLTASPVRTTSLMAARLIAKLARSPVPPAMEIDTSSPGAKCGDVSDMLKPLIKKSQYRMCMLSPVPETDTCHTLGASTLLWGDYRNIPGTGETHIYMTWRKRNCCLKFL